MATREYFLRYAQYHLPSNYYYIAGSHGRSTSAADTPASTYVPPGMEDLSFEVSIFSGIDPVPTPKGGFGSIRIHDVAGKLDYLLDLSMSGGTLTVFRGSRGADYSTFTAVASMTSAGLLYNENVKEIIVRDIAWLLESPLLNSYAGTGGAEGGATLTGQPKPYGIGELFNIPLVMLDPAKLILQVTDGAIETIRDFRSGGVTAWTLNATRASYAALEAAAAPPTNTYDVVMSGGYVRIGNPSNDFPITMDAVLDNSSPGSPYLLRGDIAKRIVTRNTVGLTSGQVDSTALSALNSAYPETCGFYWNQQLTTAQALTEVMQGILGFWFFNPIGNLFLGYVDEPTGTALRTYNWPGDFVGQNGEPAALESISQPRYRSTLGYRRNYFPQDEAKLAGAVSDADRLVYGREASFVGYETTSTRLTWPLARHVTTFSGFNHVTDAETDAGAEVTRQQALFLNVPTAARNKERIQVTVRDDPYVVATYLGGIIAIADYPRNGWSNPRKFLVAAVGFSDDARARLTLWG